MRQERVEALTHMGSDAFLLAQQLYVQLVSAGSLQTAAQVCLEFILSVDEVLNNLGTFAFVFIVPLLRK